MKRLTQLTLLLLSLSFGVAPARAGVEDPREIVWVKLDEGLQQASGWITNPFASIRSEVIMLLVDPEKYGLAVAEARTFNRKRLPVRDLTERSGALIGINANFFGKQEEILGLVLSGGKVTNKLQEGGSLLTGIFQQKKNGKLSVVHRKDFYPAGVSLALQSGPRIIENKNLLKFKKSNGVSRRSGVAITKSGKVIIFATRYRFPGASLEDIQELLAGLDLGVTDALNFDGGGSSQLFVSSSASKGKNEAIEISGGDAVPVALVVKKKPEKRRK